MPSVLYIVTRTDHTGKIIFLSTHRILIEAEAAARRYFESSCVPGWTGRAFKSQAGRYSAICSRTSDGVFGFHVGVNVTELDRGVPAAAQATVGTAFRQPARPSGSTSMDPSPAINPATAKVASSTTEKAWSTQPRAVLLPKSTNERFPMPGSSGGHGQPMSNKRAATDEDGCSKRAKIDQPSEQFKELPRPVSTQAPVPAQPLTTISLSLLEKSIFFAGNLINYTREEAKQAVLLRGGTVTTRTPGTNEGLGNPDWVVYCGDDPLMTEALRKTHVPSLDETAFTALLYSALVPPHNPNHASASPALPRCEDPAFRVDNGITGILDGIQVTFTDPSIGPFTPYTRAEMRSIVSHFGGTNMDSSHPGGTWIRPFLFLVLPSGKYYSPNVQLDLPEFMDLLRTGLLPGKHNRPAPFSWDEWNRLVPAEAPYRPDLKRHFDLSARKARFAAASESLRKIALAKATSTKTVYHPPDYNDRAWSHVETHIAGLPPRSAKTMKALEGWEVGVMGDFPTFSTNQLRSLVKFYGGSTGPSPTRDEDPVDKVRFKYLVLGAVSGDYAKKNHLASLSHWEVIDEKEFLAILRRIVNLLERNAAPGALPKDLAVLLAGQTDATTDQIVLATQRHVVSEFPSHVPAVRKQPFPMEQGITGILVGFDIHLPRGPFGPFSQAQMSELVTAFGANLLPAYKDRRLFAKEDYKFSTKLLISVTAHPKHLKQIEWEDMIEILRRGWTHLAGTNKRERNSHDLQQLFRAIRRQLELNRRKAKFGEICAEARRLGLLKPTDADPEYDENRWGPLETLQAKLPAWEPSHAKALEGLAFDISGLCFFLSFAQLSAAILLYGGTLEDGGYRTKNGTRITQKHLIVGGFGEDVTLDYEDECMYLPIDEDDFLELIREGVKRCNRDQEILQALLSE